MQCCSVQAGRCKHLKLKTVHSAVHSSQCWESIKRQGFIISNFPPKPLDWAGLSHLKYGRKSSDSYELTLMKLLHLLAKMDRQFWVYLLSFLDN